jgi:hypothetical protein
MTPFVVRADDRGHLELSIHPRGLTAGAALHALGLVLLVAASLAQRRLRGE